MLVLTMARLKLATQAINIFFIRTPEEQKVMGVAGHAGISWFLAFVSIAIPHTLLLSDD